MMIYLIMLIVASYLLGAIPWSYVLGRALRGIDLRQHGSGNLGFSNAFRILGPQIGVPVLILDVAKGFIPAHCFPRILSGGARAIVVPDATLSLISSADFGLLCGLAAIIGHMFPVYIGFRGGKGVATSMGVYLALTPKALLLTAAIALPVLIASHFVALGSLTGAVLLPIFIAILYRGMWILFAFTVVLSCLVIYAHRSNIRRLLQGTEHRFY
jgi:glycerol-3-phosphate acyltransferase PlsY